MNRFGITTEEMNNELLTAVVSFIENKKGDCVDAEYSFDEGRWLGGYDQKGLLEAVLEKFNLAGEVYNDICEHLVWEIVSFE